MADPAPNQLVTCPLNKAHQVEHYRMQTHIEKCKKQHKTPSRMICPFDATHVIIDSELDFHIKSCPKRVLLDSQMYVVDNDYRPVTEVQGATAAVECEEDWETTNTTTYIPDPSKKGPHIITKVKGVPPSERRKARSEAIRTYRPPEQTD